MPNSNDSSEINNRGIVFSSQNISLMDEGVYHCGGMYGSGQLFGENVTISVRGKMKISSTFVTPGVYCKHKSIGVQKIWLFCHNPVITKNLHWRNFN